MQFLALVQTDCSSKSVTAELYIQNTYVNHWPSWGPANFPTLDTPLIILCIIDIGVVIDGYNHALQKKVLLFWHFCSSPELTAVIALRNDTRIVPH